MSAMNSLYHDAIGNVKHYLTTCIHVSYNLPHHEKSRSYGGSEEMAETAIQIRADGTAEIYRRGRQYLRVRGDDGEPRWLKRSSRGLRPVSDHRARQLDRIFRHAETAKAFCRRPRLEWERK